MAPSETTPTNVNVSMAEYPVTVLLVDDQAMIGEAIRRMLARDPEIRFHFCCEPTKAIEMANEIKPTVILQDLVMPDIDGLTLVKFYRANPATRDVPLIVLSTKEEAATKAEAFALGANDYLVKLPEAIELIARIRYHSRGYISLLQRNEAYDALETSQKALAGELAKAAKYVMSMLPQPMDQPVKTAWKFIPSMQLGGDAFGYHWLDDQEHCLAIYLLDVCGHGVGAALMSVSAMNTLREKTLPDVDFHQPGEVLNGLNEAFQMERHNGMFFTIWYGVYDTQTRRLLHASGGHHAAIMLRSQLGQKPTVKEIHCNGPLIGAMQGLEYASAEFQVEPGDRLYVFCDGVFEIYKPDGEMWDMEGFVDVLAQPSQPGVAEVDRILNTVREVRGQDVFDDDLSLLEIGF